jgi:hypothetical protein
VSKIDTEKSVKHNKRLFIVTLNNLLLCLTDFSVSTLIQVLHKQKVKGKGKFHPRTGHEGPDEE